MDDTRNALQAGLPERRKAGQASHLPEISPISLTSLLYALSLFIFYYQGFIGGTSFIAAAAGVLGWVLMFYAVFRSGAHLRMADPSLVLPQIGAALATMLLVAYLEPSTRIALVPFMLVAFSFGVCRLTTSTITLLAMLCLLSHLGIVLAHAQVEGYGMEFRAGLLQWFVLALTLPAMIAVGKQIQTLRLTLRATRHQLEHYEERSIRDDLTGLYNRRQLQMDLERARLTCGARSASFSLCLIDVDHFKQINDSHGHLAGDTVLRDFARIARDSVRDSDILGRFGGDEFMLILPETDLKGAVVHAERLRVYAQFLDFSRVMEQRHISLSIGVAQYRPGEKVTDLIARADAGLYRAKQLGRNRVEWVD
ncbi:diguanylate cyclase (GGDEF) domain-containing protein [Noviherbaspirillum humi]|uniref:diguanylate cyclase n=2 Tax=Noviherbaspirillum humi TaxID=1688639 RepID=A0A239CMJ9_9BURK|nr:diguanylate cyclase (GGDEF) domain-containing protein [Noviherbaspirillum humi]